MDAAVADAAFASADTDGDGRLTAADFVAWGEDAEGAGGSGGDRDMPAALRLALMGFARERDLLAATQRAAAAEAAAGGGGGGVSELDAAAAGGGSLAALAALYASSRGPGLGAADLAACDAWLRNTAAGTRKKSSA